MHETDRLIEQAVTLLRGARYGVALTGAGISTPSGIPDFRSPHSGLWEQVDAMEVASIYGFRRRPEAFFNWVRPLTNTILEARPNPAHIALAQLEERGYIRVVITQNIDDLHARAGSRTVYETHGHLREATCVECFSVYDATELIPVFVKTGEIPRCPKCRGILKPNVILFGEQLPIAVLQASRRAAQQCDVMLVAGSSLSVVPVSDLPLVALQNGAKLIILNYEQTYIDSQASVVIRADVAYVLPRMVEMLADNAHDTA